MKKIFHLAVFTCISFVSLFPQRAQAELPVRAKAFLTIVGYGAGGGAILGAASMAFGTSTRAIAQGASLGLYAGIIFGTYVLVSHHNKRTGSYDDGSSPYRDSTDIYGDDYQEDQGGSSDAGDGRRKGFFDRFKVMQEKFHAQAFTFDSEKKRGSRLPPLEVNIIQYNF